MDITEFVLISHLLLTTLTLTGAKSGQVRIIGGEAVTANSLPYQLLMLTKEKKTEGQALCGAVLIAKNFALTAAHCTYKKNFETHKIRLWSGKHKIDKRESTQQDGTIVEVYQHSDYKPGKELNDIALLKIDPPFKLDKATKPIELPAADYLPEKSEDPGEVSGWGCTVQDCDGNVALELRSVKVPLSSNDDCGTKYDNKISATMLCAEDTTNGGKDACQGDSGGPLVQLNNKEKVLIGIVSWGEGCGVKDKPGVYTRVTSYLQWISDCQNASS